MTPKRKERKGHGAAERPDAGMGLHGIILERFKRLNGLPLHKLDWESEFFLHHVLGAKRRAS